jgi:hypothetical protein
VGHCQCNFLPRCRYLEVRDRCHFYFLSTHALGFTVDRPRSCSMSSRSTISERILPLLSRSFEWLACNLPRTKGRVDFYIPSKQWGVKLLRFANKVVCNVSRSLTTSFLITVQRIPRYRTQVSFFPLNLRHRFAYLTFLLPLIQTFQNCTILSSVTTSVRCGS